MNSLLHANWAVGPLIFLGGLVSCFSPCVAPLLPGYIGFLAGGRLGDSTAGDGEGAGLASEPAPPFPVRPAWQVSLLFVSGFSLAFVALGLLAASFGAAIAAYKPVVETLVGIVMLAMGAFLLGLLPRGWSALLMREKRLHLSPQWTRRLGPAGPVVVGALFAAGWTPCIGPVLAALLTYVGATANIGMGALWLGVYSAGFAVPFLALGFGWSASMRSLGWIKRHGRAVELASGITLVLVGVLYVSGQATTFAAWAQRVSPQLPAPILH